MKSILSAVAVLLFPFWLHAQHQLLQLTPQEQQWHENELLRSQHNLHPAIRPWRQSEMQPYSRRGELLPDSIAAQQRFWNWVGRKLWQEDFLSAKGEDYHFTLNPVVGFSYGQDAQADYDFTYQNSRGARIELALGDKVTAYSTLVETQARLPWHVTDFVRRNRAVVPGYWLSKGFREGARDYAYVAGEVAYTPNEQFHFRLGHGKQFLGEGYRSMLISDNSVNYPFFRIETTFWKIKYVNTWAVLNDLRDSLQIGSVFAKKYLSMHYLSMNIGKRLNIGLFEGMMWGDELNRYGFDINFLNPVIFYRPVEFLQGFDGGNILIGANASYSFPNGIMTYGQMAIDEFTFSAIRNWEEGDWRNMMSWQIGAKWGDALGIRNLFLRAEYNIARPYIYSHREILTNWGHYNQPLAHPWGANFEELLFKAHYRYGRWSFDGAFHYGQLGRDSKDSNWGGNIFKSFDSRSAETGVFVGQGVKGQLTYWSAELSYLFNPIYNLRLQCGIRSRRETSAEGGFPDSKHVFFGLRTNMYTSYQDF